MSPIFYPISFLPRPVVAQHSLLESIVGNEQEHAGELKLQWTNFPESWGVFLLIAIVAAVVMAVIWMYRREINTCPPAVKMLMAGLRLAVLFLLIAMFLKPSIFYQQVSEIKPSITVLRDSSMSLARGDKYRDTDQANRLAELSGLSAEEISSGTSTRIALLSSALEKHPELVHQIREKGSVRVVNFADTAETVSVLPATDDNSRKEDEDPTTDSDTELDSDADADTAMAADEVETPATFPVLVADGLGTNIASPSLPLASVIPTRLAT